jgi:hypothetical protein
MPEVRLRPGKGTLTNHGKRLISRSMYQKGKGFIGAAVLLSHHEGHEFVVLHLLAQGIEITLKGLLIFKDYDKYRPRLKGAFGHNLEAIASEACGAFRLNRARPPLANQLHRLSTLYAKHLLRYGSFYDVLIDPHTIPSDLILRRIAAVLRLADRQLSTSLIGA